MGRPPRDPEAAVRAARDRLRRHSLVMVRRLERLTEEVDRSAPVCPACKRGTRRDDELLLKAILAALDRGGVGAGKAAELPGEGQGPMLVFPPGTKVAVMAEAPGETRAAPALLSAEDWRPAVAGQPDGVAR